MTARIPGLVNMVKTMAADKGDGQPTKIRFAIMSMADDEVMGYGPSETIQELAAAYPRPGSAIEAWQAYQKTYDARLPRSAVNGWATTIVNAARKKVEDNA